MIIINYTSILPYLHQDLYQRVNPQDYENGVTFILDYLNEKERNDPRVQAMFKISKHNKLSIFISSQDCYELPNRTIRAIGNIYHIFKPNNFRHFLKSIKTKVLWI